MRKLIGCGVIVAGLAIAYAGYRWGASFEKQAKDFHGNPSGDPRGVKQLAAMALTFAGLMLAMIFGPMFLIAG